MRFLIYLFVLSLLFNTFFPVFGSDSKVLDSKMAGSWYTSDSAKLRSELNSYINNVQENDYKDILALIQPHAGYKYSGQTAAYGYKALIGKKFSRVIILGPSHSQLLYNKISIPEYEYYQTPLGKVEIDREFISRLHGLEYLIQFNRAHDFEHSVQMQIPFLQTVLSNFKIVPMVVGKLDYKAIKQIAGVIRKNCDDKTLVIASSDFVHYGPSFNYMPFKHNFQTESMIKKLDFGTFEFIKNRAPEGFLKYVKRTGATVCGKYPIAILLSIFKNDSSAKLLHYDTSGRQLGDFKDSVSYMSIIFTKDESVGKLTDKSVLDNKDKQLLLSLARKTIEYFFDNKKVPTAQQLGIEITEDMRQVMGVFVTLHKFGSLRGCIGEIFPRRPLYQAVMAQSINAAINDYRFRKVTSDELKDIDIEISALTPPKEVESYKDIVIGRDGMTFSLDGRSAVFLPQVATEQNWNLDETLSHLAVKAGLPPDSYRDRNARFSVFQAIVFHEK